ncbi:hypothetical protein AN958_04667 [Leucoagaricus sp. SymC.cos]|nr:hypothetical protein AN958_04667 [Leucoagaricus sp. SymC.cos]
MNATASLAPSSATPTPNLAGRLRELIHLVPNGSSQNTPVPYRPPSPTFHESDFEGESTAAGHSRARESLRDIFSKALREPGDTPQKNRQRSNSDSSASEMDVSPANSRKWSDAKGKRKSLSDEEPLSDTNSTNKNFLPLESTTHPILRTPRDTNGTDFPLKTISAEDSDDADESSNPRRISSSIPPSTTLESLRISQNSSLPQQSNLLDQDSEMHRAFGELESSDADERLTHAYKPYEQSRRDSVEPRSSSTTPAPKKPSASRSHTPKHTRNSLGSSTPNQTTSTIKPTPRPSDRQVDGKERASGHRRTSLQGLATPGLKHKSSASSATSVSDYGERMKEMERERNHERERDWNRPHPRVTRPGSSLSLHSPQPTHRSRTSSISSMESIRPGSAMSNMSIDSGESPHTRVRTSSGLSNRPRTNLTGNRPGSALSNDSMPIADFPQNLRRHNSLTSRADSPASSKGNGSQPEETEIEHERERNWNAPRPKWHRRSLPNTPDRLTSPRSTKPSSPHSPANIRRESTTPQTALKDASNTTRSGSSLARRHSQPKVVPSPSPAERRGTGSSLSVKSPNTHIPSVVTSTPARPRSPLSGHGSHGKSRLPVPSARANGSRVETPKVIAEIHIQDEIGHMQTKSTVSFPQAINGQSLSQQSMELTEAYSGHDNNSAIPSFSDFSHQVPTTNNDTMHTASLLGPTHSQDGMYESYEDEENPLVQKRTPTLQTVSPPPDDSYPQEWHKSLSPNEELQENFPSFEESEPASPDIQPSDANQSSSIPSFLSTPPRSHHSSFNSSKPEFQTPSPPKGLPDLPGPPSSVSGDEVEEESIPQFNITPANPVADGVKNGDMTTFKTPKPPGAWFATPGPASDHPPPRDDSTPPFLDSSDDGLPNAKPHAQSIFPQTPAPPGGWMKTPAAERRRAQSDPESIMNEGGLTTPVASLGKASRPSKTPAPPGGWMNTPGYGSARKSVLKVRFDPEVTSGENASSDTLPESSVSQTNELRSSTPEPITPATPPSRSPRKHKRSPPSVRMVDAYGNEQKENRNRKRDSPSPTPSSPRSRSGIRILDALGREVKEDPEEDSRVVDEEDILEPSQTTPLTRAEALQRVRQGIQELAEGIESLDLYVSGPSKNDASRLKELDETSRALKQSRENIAQDMHRAEKQLRRQVRQRVIASSFLGRNGWFILCVGLVQLVLIFIMYRASVLRARKLFLTNYYDPFNPDLFLYTTNPDTQYATLTTSWSLVAQAVRRGDITAFTGAFRENLSILIKRWHQHIWDVWGDDPNRPVGAWPPT